MRPKTHWTYWNFIGLGSSFADRRPECDHYFQCETSYVLALGILDFDDDFWSQVTLERLEKHITFESFMSAIGKKSRCVHV